MNKNLKQNEKWFWCAVIIVEVILFYSSSMTYKQQTSVPFLEKYLINKPFYHSLTGIHFSYSGKVQSIANDGYFHFVEFFVRKGAHFSIYLVLGIFICLALYTYFGKNYFLKVFVPWMMVTGLAAFDEFHQGLTGGRTPLVDDVILDSIGSLVGIIIVVIVLELIRKKKESKIRPRIL